MVSSSDYCCFGFIALAYLCGSIPSGVILMRLFTSSDPRRGGSGNIGATNVRRIAGARLGLLTLIGDIGKGFLPVLLAQAYCPKQPLDADTLIAVVAFFAVIGHMYPVFLKLREGGKGVATTAGSFLMISPWAVFGAFVLFVAVLLASQRVSVGSLVGSAMLPVAIFISGQSPSYTISATAVAFLIVWRHRENINRLIAGTEPRFNEKTDKVESSPQRK